MKQSSATLAVHRLSGWQLAARMLVLVQILMHCIPVVLYLPATYQTLLNLDPRGYFTGWTSAEIQSALTALGISSQTLAGVLFATSLFCLLCFWGVGAVLFWRKFDSWIGPLSAFVLTGIAVGFAMLIWEPTGFPPWIQFLFSLDAALIWPTFFIVLYLFPDGKFVPRFARFLAPLPYAIFLTALITEAFYREAPAWAIWVLLIFALGGAASQVYRYIKVSDAGQRRQIKWVVYATGIFILLLFQGQLTPILVPSLNSKTPAAFLYLVIWNDMVGMLAATLIPISIGISILRNRLWDIDLIIRRTLVYGVLSSILGLVYFGSVVILRQILGGITGQSTLVVALSTLLIVALFNPLRRRMQDVIDRRFFRRKYDAARALAKFSETSRNEMELEAISSKLAMVVVETVQPESFSLWLRKERKRNG
jgi:hypothetical protein